MKILKAVQKSCRLVPFHHLLAVHTPVSVAYSEKLQCDAELSEEP